MSEKLNKFKQFIRNLLKENFVDHSGNQVDTEYNNDDSIIARKPDLNNKFLNMLKAYIDVGDLPPIYEDVLNAPDAKIYDEFDTDDGIYTVHSKQLNRSFDFAYQNSEYEDWAIILPEPHN
jgi:sugar/nucleoside kinase (ribokinase family)